MVQALAGADAEDAGGKSTSKALSVKYGHRWSLLAFVEPENQRSCRKIRSLIEKEKSGTI